MPVPHPSRAHPLAGLWRAAFTAPAEPPEGAPGEAGEHGEARVYGVQVLAVTYDFSGAAARMVAVKVPHRPCAACARSRGWDLQVLAVAYDFSGAAAQTVAEKWRAVHARLVQGFRGLGTCFAAVVGTLMGTAARTVVVRLASRACEAGGYATCGHWRFIYEAQPCVRPVRSARTYEKGHQG